jgi:RNA-binding motif X-linked protein 2
MSSKISEIRKINENELSRGVCGGDASSWHAGYGDSAYVFVGGLDYELTEGDVICVFSQFGEVVDCNLLRDKTSGESRGVCFVAYEDVRSTILAVDNMNGASLCGRLLSCDHVKDYRRPLSERRNDIDRNDDDALRAAQQESDADYDARRRVIWDYEAFDAFQRFQQEKCAAAVQRQQQQSSSSSSSTGGSGKKSSSGGGGGYVGQPQETGDARILAMMAKRKQQKVYNALDSKGKDDRGRGRHGNRDNRDRRRGQPNSTSSSSSSSSSSGALKRARSRSPERDRDHKKHKKKDKKKKKKKKKSKKKSRRDMPDGSESSGSDSN